MKNILLVLGTILSVSAFSQFTIDKFDFGTLGDQIIYEVDSAYVDDSSNISKIGSEQIWDFTTISPIFIDTVVFQNPSELDSSGKFNSSDFGYDGQLFSTFMSVNINKVVMDGIASEFSGLIDTSFLDSSIIARLPKKMSFKYPNGLYYLNLPAEFNDSDNGTVEGNFTFYYGDSVMGFKADSIRIRETVEYVGILEGSGKIKLNAGEYYTLKQYAYYKRSYSVDVGAFIGPFIFYVPVLENFFSINQKSYRWFGEDQKFPIVEINTDSAETFIDARIQLQPSGLTVEEYDSVNTLGFSDAMSKKVIINYTSSGVDVNGLSEFNRILVYDLSGKIIYQNEVDSEKMHIDIENKGVYMFYFSDRNNQSVIKKICY